MLLRRFFITLLCLSAVGLIVYGLWGLGRSYERTHTPSAGIPAEVVTHSTDTPDETPPVEACDNYSVPDDQPRKIDIPSVGISGCIQRVGIDQHKAIAVPTNIHLAGWYTDSVAPGEKGVSIVDGHVLGRYQDAIFKNLADIQAGASISIQFGDYSWKIFEVIAVSSYPVDQVMTQLLVRRDGVSAQLNLITCGGNFDKSSQSYDQRVIVQSKLLEDS